MKITIDDIARISGYSRATVCRVIAGNTNVKASTREAILHVIHQNDYASSALARERDQKRPVAMIVGDIVDTESSSHLFHPRIIKTICKRMDEEGYPFLLFNSEYSCEQEDIYLQRCLKIGVSGIFLLSATGSAPQLQKAAEKVPLVTINRETHTPFTDSILLDEYKCAYLAVQHLHELGHRKIALISENKQIPLVFETDRGFCDACSQLGIPDAEKHIFRSKITAKDGFAIGKELLDSNRRITGIYCLSYDVANGLKAACRQANLTVPEDVSIVIFQSILEQAQKNKAAYTSVGAYDMEAIANAAADTMLQRLQEGNSATDRRLSVIMDTTLIKGKSTAPAPCP